MHVANAMKELGLSFSSPATRSSFHMGKADETAERCRRAGYVSYSFCAALVVRFCGWLQFLVVVFLVFAVCVDGGAYLRVVNRVLSVAMLGLLTL
jgi:hypothetical protein